jgi:hypothetical protein
MGLHRGVALKSQRQQIMLVLRILEIQIKLKGVLQKTQIQVEFMPEEITLRILP